MRHRIPPRLSPPKIGDLVRLSGPGGLGRVFKRSHGVGLVVKITKPDGLVVKITKPDDRRVRYQVKWLKSDERMDFHEEDLIVVSNVD